MAPKVHRMPCHPAHMTLVPVLGGPALGSGSCRGSLLGPLTVLRWAAQGLACTGCWWEEAARTQKLGGPGSLGASRVWPTSLLILPQPHTTH